jgi:hypothetical protein
MNAANRLRIGERGPAALEQELAALNARAESPLTYDDEAWDDAVSAAADDCASLCESLRADTGRDSD